MPLRMRGHTSYCRVLGGRCFSSARYPCISRNPLEVRGVAMSYHTVELEGFVGSGFRRLSDQNCTIKGPKLSYARQVDISRSTIQAKFCARSSRTSPYTLHAMTYTLHPTPYTLHPTPYTQNPKPYTSHPTPHTPHPTSHTLHPTPYNLLPTPYTLHPTPYDTGEIF